MQYKIIFLLVPLFWWFIPAFVSIVYIITSVFYPKLYADSYLIAFACLFLGFFIICILATDSTSKANKNDHLKDQQLSVSYSAANDSIRDDFIAWMFINWLCFQCSVRTKVIKVKINIVKNWDFCSKQSYLFENIVIFIFYWSNYFIVSNNNNYTYLFKPVNLIKN